MEEARADRARGCKGAVTALITTEGLHDAVEIDYEHHFEQYHVYLKKPEPLMPRRRRYSVPERVSTLDVSRAPSTPCEPRIAARELPHLRVQRSRQKSASLKHDRQQRVVSGIWRSDTTYRIEPDRLDIRRLILLTYVAPMRCMSSLIQEFTPDFLCVPLRTPQGGIVKNPLRLCVEM